MTTGDGAPGPAAGYDAVVLAGGAAARLGGADKPGLTVGGRSLLDRVVAACEGADRIVVVGPQRATAGVRWAREEPPGGGPVAAVAAGLAQVTADRVLLLAADLPFLDRRTLECLLAALDDPAPDNPALDDPALDDPAPGDPAPDGPAPDGPAGEHPRAEAALLVDAAGREQPLTAAYRTAALRRALAGLGDPAGRPLRRLLAPLRTVRLADPDRVAYDCDTWAELAAARQRDALTAGGPDG